MSLYAFLKPKKEPPENVRIIKESAKETLRRVSKGEEVVTTVVHSEVSNVIESRAGKKRAVDIVRRDIVRSVLTAENIKVLTSGLATLMAEEKNLRINDALAYVKMKEAGISEIYPFDRDFERLDVKVVRD